MEQIINVPVFIEETGKIITLNVSLAEAERAKTDLECLSRLIQEKSPSHSTEMYNLERQGLEGPSNNENGSSAPDTPVTSIFIWSSACVNLLLSLCEDFEAEFKSGNKRHNKIWEKISNHMVGHGYQVSWSQCQSKLNGLKKTYKKILDHNNISGNDRMNWPYFEKMNEIFGSTGWAHPKALATEAGPSTPNNSTTSDMNEMPKRRKRVWDQANLEDRLKCIENNRIEWQKINRIMNESGVAITQSDKRSCFSASIGFLPPIDLVSHRDGPIICIMNLNVLGYNLQ